MIPLIVGAIAGLAGAGGIAAAKDMQREAEETLEKAKKLYDESKVSLETQQKKTEFFLKKLGNEKIYVLTKLLPKFVAAFEKFHDVDFRNSAGIDELRYLKIEQFSNSDFADIKQLADTSISLKNGAVAGGATGAVIALGAGTITVDAMCGAGTIGMVASSVGVVEAADLALVGIGGLAPGLAVVAGPALLVGGISSMIKADENLDRAKTAYAQSREAAEKMETAKCLCVQIENRSDMFYDMLIELESLLRLSIKELNRIVRTSCSIPVAKKPFLPIRVIANLFKIELDDRIVSRRGKKNNFNNLTTSEKEFLAVSGSIAKAVKAIIDTPMLDCDGNVTHEAEMLSDDLDEKITMYGNQQRKLLTIIR